MIRRFQFTLRTLLVTVLIVALGTWAARWVLYPPPPDVSIEVEPIPFVRYDDGAGNLPLGAAVKITNLSTSTAWYLGYPGSPVLHDQQLVGGQWKQHGSYVNDPRDPLPRWAPLRSMESITIVAGPISEMTIKMRVGLAFTTERLRPTEAHWIFSQVFTIVKKGQDYFAEPKPGTEQKEQVVSLSR